jgi:hypothetical protein
MSIPPGYELIQRRIRRVAVWDLQKMTLIDDLGRHVPQIIGKKAPS